jgi:hypothetical protein
MGFAATSARVLRGAEQLIGVALKAGRGTSLAELHAEGEQRQCDVQ